MRDYGTATWEGGDPECQHVVGNQIRDHKAPGAIVTGARPGVDASTCFKCGARRIDKQLGLERVHDCLGWATGEPCGECYVCHLIAVFREVKRVLRKDGVAWLNLGDSFAGGGAIDPYRRTSSGKLMPQQGRAPVAGNLKPKDLVGIPWRVAFALQADGWWLRSDVIWAKGLSFCDEYAGSTMPESVTDRPTKAHEDIFLLTKNERYFYDHEAVKEANSSEAQLAHNLRYARPYEAYDSRGGPSGTGQPGNENNRGIHARPGGAGRNLRDVWAINPTPYKEAHFATFSPSLVEPMIKAGTSEKGACPRCGAPWERVVERGLTAHDGETASAYGKGSMANRLAMLRQAARERGGEYTNGARTIGWQPTCSCNASDPVPCIVLDPFSGAGTTVLVADRLGRCGVALELKREYAEMARRRVFNDAPLLALWEAAS